MQNNSKSQRNLREVSFQIFKHSRFVYFGLHYCGFRSFEDILDPLSSSELPHIVDDANLKATSVEVEVIDFFYFHDQNQRVIDDLIFREIVQSC